MEIEVQEKTTEKVFASDKHRFRRIIPSLLFSLFHMEDRYHYYQEKASKFLKTKAN